MTPDAPVLVAHRAGNDLESLRTAEAIGADLIEADVHVYRGRLEVRHLKTVGPLPILWDRWYLASPFTPRLGLGDLLSAAAPGTDLLLDLKGPSRRVSRLVLAELGRHEAGGRISVCARNRWLLDPFRGHPEIGVIVTVASRRQRARTLHRHETLAGVSINHALCSHRTVAALRRRAPVVIAWGVADAARARALAAMGVNGFSVTDLRLIRELRGDPELAVP